MSLVLCNISYMTDINTLVLRVLLSAAKNNIDDYTPEQRKLMGNLVDRAIEAANESR